MAHELPTVAFIGSCRVVNSLLPLRDTGKIKVSGSSLGVYTHSVKEAIQRVRLMSGIHIPPHLNRYVYDRDEAPVISETARSALHDVDVYVIEICSPRELSWGENSLQINFFSKHLLEKWPAALSPWFADLNAFRPWGIDEIESLVAHPDWSRSGLTSEQIDFMKGVGYTVQDDVSMRADVGRLADALQKPIVIVSHFNISKDPAEQIRIRSDLSKMLKRAVEGTSIRFYDPTDLVLSVGRSKSLAKEGEDVNHYAPEFEPILSEHFYEAALRGL